MADLSSFAELIKRAKEEKQQQQLAETERKNKEVAPLLSELFSSVVKAKEVKKEAVAQAAPLLAELQSALANPDKIRLEKQEKHQKIVDLVVELEQSAQEKVETQDVDEKIDAALAEADKRFLKLFNRLQNDLQTLKRHIDSKPSTIIQQGSSGGGEVRILRMDDIDRTVTPETGDTLVWSSVLNKFELKSVSEVTGLTNPVNYLDFNQTAGLVAGTGQLTWNDIDGTLDLGLKGGNVTLQVGQENHVRVLNNTDADMFTPQVIRLSGAQGNRLTAELSIASSNTFADNTFAVVTENILKNQQGFATISGLVRDIDTSAFPEGSDLFLSSTTAGAITHIAPSAPARIIRIGYCVRSHQVNGSIFVAVLEHPDIIELGSTSITAPQNNEVLTYDSDVGLWKNKAVIAEGDEVLSKRTDFVGENIIYKGEAQVGSAEDSAAWRIRRITIGEDSDIAETWAAGTALYDKTWTDRLTYTYI